MTRMPAAPPEILGPPLFPRIMKGTFINRPNRFVVECALEGRKIVVYLPNPGKLWELLLPGRIVYLTEKTGQDPGKLKYTAVAVEREGNPVLLHTHMSNNAAARLIEADKIPGLEGARIDKQEVTVGHSRFDFLLTKDGRPFYLEIKSCTLFGRRIAMFPDAVTIRGKRHMEELTALSRQGVSCGIIFLVHWPQVSFFLPDYHTDLDFALAFKRAREALFIKALSLKWTPDLSLSSNVRDVAIPWKIIEREAKDSGSYLVMLHVESSLNITVGSLGTLFFPRGYYLYVGSAKNSLSKRLARHMRKNKTLNWHIDYLRERADSCISIPIRASAPLEHRLAKALQNIAGWTIPAFGSSDCKCPSHLFGFNDNPLKSQVFIDFLQYFRIDRLEEDIYS